MEIVRSCLTLLFVAAGAPLALAQHHHPPAAQEQPAFPGAEVELQPLAAQVHRIAESLGYLGEPLLPDERRRIEAAIKLADQREAVRELSRVLEPRVLCSVAINPEMRVKVASGPAAKALLENGWRHFLLKVTNESGTTAPLRVTSPNARSVHNALVPPTDSDVQAKEERAPTVMPPATDAWLDLQTYDSAPMTATLSGLPLEYRIVQLYSRDPGLREARLVFDVGQATQDLGFRSEIDLLFRCAPARSIRLEVRDEHGKPAVGSFTIRDGQGRVYPSQPKRLAPDFAFHPQVYRGFGEVIRLPDGDYEVEFQRGPESVAEQRRVAVRGDGVWKFQVQRWIDPAALGWWSGDHHIHAAGCAHYSSPTEGVLAKDMARHIQGEDLKVGANLTWGPGFDYQKQFFTGRDDGSSVYPYILRYDIEVSGYGSHRSGHLCLLRLREQIFPGGDSSAHWPTLGLNTLRWAKAQGAVTGTAHSGLGLGPLRLMDVKPAPPQPGEPTHPTDVLPNYIVPPYNGVGANEFVVNVTHEVPGADGRPVPAVDFYALLDTPHTWELNMWYHVLNAGFRTRASGETDFPCLYGERVGLGRSYVKLTGSLGYDAWCDGIRDGRSYVSDGKSHLLEFRVEGLGVGENGSELRIESPRSVRATAKVAAYLEIEPNPSIRDLAPRQKPWWHVERARIGDSRNVPVELLVNGVAVACQEIPADGTLRDVVFDFQVSRSSWVALRIRPSSHTNPVFVIVSGKPIRASRRSVEWCLKGVDQCWSQKQKFIAPAEMEEAIAAYEHARVTYRARLAECDEE